MAIINKHSTEVPVVVQNEVRDVIGTVVCLPNSLEAGLTSCKMID